jgi:hypothetical protein
MLLDLAMNGSPYTLLCTELCMITTLSSTVGISKEILHLSSSMDEPLLLASLLSSVLSPGKCPRHSELDGALEHDIPHDDAPSDIGPNLDTLLTRRIGLGEFTTFFQDGPFQVFIPRVSESAASEVLHQTHAFTSIQKDVESRNRPGVCPVTVVRILGSWCRCHRGKTVSWRL